MLIHSYIWGPSLVKINIGVDWYITFIDNHNRVCWVYLLKEKYEVVGVFKQFHKMILNQFETNIRILHTDNEREYYPNILGEHLQKEGIIHRVLTLHNKMECRKKKNRHFLEVAHAMMCQMNIPKVLWGEVALTKSYFINRKPTHLLKYETLINTLKQCFIASHHLFSFLNPKVFGYTTFVHIHGQIVASLILGHINAFSLDITYSEWL